MMTRPPRGYRGTALTEIKKSRFICDLARTDSETEARAFLDDVRSAYPDARHHCLAYVICLDGVRLTRTSDGGEPAGTAGVPMLNALASAEVENVTAVVTRYFGGIKLGAGGLVRAYGGAVSAALAAMPRVVAEVQPIWALTLPYGDAGRVPNEFTHSAEAKETVDERSEEYADAGRVVRQSTASPEAKDGVDERSEKYAEVGRLQEKLIRQGAAILGLTYDTTATLRFTYLGDVPDLIARLTQGTLRAEPVGQQVVEVPAGD